MTESAGVSEHAKELVRGPRGFLAETLSGVFGRWGARLGLAWILIVGFFAVFGPLVASSHPLLMKDGSGWSSPLLVHLTPTDVVLLLGTLSYALLLGVRSVGRGGRVVLALWVVALITPFAFQALARRAWAGGYATGLDTALNVAGLVVCAAAVVGLPVLVRLPGKAWAVSGVVGGVLSVGLVVFPVETPENAVLSQYREALRDGSDATMVFTLIPYSPNDLNPDAPILPATLAPGRHFTEAQVVAELERLADLAVPNDAEEADALVAALVADAQAKAGVVRETGVAVDEVAPRSVDVGNRLASVRMVEIALTPRDQRLHLMGTTADGEDLASRMIHACRIALAIGFIATGIAVVIGVLIGGLMGYFSGWIDLIGMRLLEVFSAIPTIFLLIAFVAFYGRNLYLMMAILGITGWVGYALFVRAEFLKLRQADYVQAARAAGVPLLSVLMRHMLPNALTPIIVTASFGVAGAILTESTLSFLGLGLVEEPSWGQMLQQARSGGTFFWWLFIYPILAIFLTVFAYNLIGEALREALDPRSAK